jgi:membrane protein
VVLWTVGATAFSFYLSAAPSFSATYGALAGVIVTLLFFYLTGAVIIFGAELNAAIRRDRLARAAIADTPDAEPPEDDVAEAEVAEDAGEGPEVRDGKGEPG